MKQFIFIFVFVVILSSLSNAGILTFTAYRTPAQVETDLNLLATTYPALTKITSIGNSIQGRQIKVLKISSTPNINDNKKGDVVFLALHHAREWLTVEMAMYLADELLARYSTDNELATDINNLQIWIVPIVNPDGYQYSYTTYRNWRKNRRDNGDGTFGVDLNRNYSYQWGITSSGIEGSNNPLEDTYHGTSSFSEPEVATIRDFLSGLTNFKCFLTYHTYWELFLRPWSYTLSDPPGEATLNSIVERSINRIAAIHGHTYAEEISYRCNGEATDYVWNGYRSAAFTTEMRPTSSSLGGFAPPATEIIPNNEENLPAALALIHDAARTGLWMKDYDGDNGSEPSAEWLGVGWSHAFWESPDIWTDPAIPVAGTTVNLKIQIRNNTGNQMGNVTVEAYYNDPSFSIDFPDLHSNLIDRKIVSVPPGGKTIIMDWNVPEGLNNNGENHWCVGALVKHDEDMPLTTQVQRTSNIACRNFHPMIVTSSMVFFSSVFNPLDHAAEVKLNIDKKGLPFGVDVTPRFSVPRKDVSIVTSKYRKARLINSRGIILDPKESINLPIRLRLPDNIKTGTEFDVKVHYSLQPLIAGKREVIGNGNTYHIVVGKK